MISICQGCGGVLGIHCFNQRECLERAHDSYLFTFLQRDLADTEDRIQFLEQFILDRGLEIPHSVIENSDEEFLPF